MKADSFFIMKGKLVRYEVLTVWAKTRVMRALKIGERTRNACSAQRNTCTYCIIVGTFHTTSFCKMINLCLYVLPAEGKWMDLLQQKRAEFDMLQVSGYICCGGVVHNTELVWLYQIASMVNGAQKISKPILAARCVLSPPRHACCPRTCSRLFSLSGFITSLNLYPRESSCEDCKFAKKNIWNNRDIRPVHICGQVFCIKVLQGHSMPKVFINVCNSGGS